MGQFVFEFSEIIEELTASWNLSQCGHTVGLRHLPSLLIPLVSEESKALTTGILGLGTW